METEYLRIFKKNGEWDFGVSGNMGTVSKEEVAEFRSTLVTAIYIAENMMRREWSKGENGGFENNHL